jgi:hypothetical protein
MGFNSAFKGLRSTICEVKGKQVGRFCGQSLLLVTSDAQIISFLSSKDSY